MNFLQSSSGQFQPTGSAAVSPYGGVRLAVSFVLSSFLQGAHVQLWTPTHQHLHLLRPQQLHTTREAPDIYAPSRLTCELTADLMKNVIKMDFFEI